MVKHDIQLFTTTAAPNNNVDTNQPNKRRKNKDSIVARHGDLQFYYFLSRCSTPPSLTFFVVLGIAANIPSNILVTKKSSISSFLMLNVF